MQVELVGGAVEESWNRGALGRRLIMEFSNLQHRLTITNYMGYWQIAKKPVLSEFRNSTVCVSACVCVCMWMKCMPE